MCSSSSSMESHKTHVHSHGAGKLTRTPSSLLRSPPFRAATSAASVSTSFYNLSSIVDSHHQPGTPNKPPHRLANLKPHLGHPPLLVFLLPLVLVFPFLLFLFLYYLLDFSLLLFLSVLVSLVLSVLASKPFLRYLRRRLRRVESSVQWFIGDSDTSFQKLKSNGNDDKASAAAIREGVEFYSNGDCYEGEFHRGRCNGSGVRNYLAHGKYEGDWVDGKYDGYGIESWARGSRYRGQYRQGLRHGFGVYRFYSGDCYAGEWASGQSHGIGVQSCSDGSSYVGEFKCGVKHGLGCYHFRNGDQYAGEYFGDKIHGFGVYNFANGHSYEGSWHEGKKQGFGMYTFRNGDVKCGDWDSGSIKNPCLPSDPAVQRAVLAARRAAGNAVQLPRVDDLVNNAVAAANRAATSARVAAIKAVHNRMDGKFCSPVGNYV